MFLYHNCLLYLNCFHILATSDRPSVQNCISGSRRKEDRGTLLLFNPLWHRGSNIFKHTLSKSLSYEIVSFYLIRDLAERQPPLTVTRREPTSWNIKILKGTIYQYIFPASVIYCGNADLEINAEWQKEAATFRAFFFFALLDNTSRPSNA
jgi:hypothetical protein